jgi:hypothetical protein
VTPVGSSLRCHSLCDSISFRTSGGSFANVTPPLAVSYSPRRLSYDRRFTLLSAADRHDHVGARSRQRAEPEVTVGPGHDREPAGQVGGFRRQLVAHQVTGSS